MSVETRSVTAKPMQQAWKVGVGVIMFGVLANLIPFMGFAPALSALQKELAISFTQLGFFVGMNGIIGPIAAVPIGVFIKRYGSKTASLMGLACLALGLGILGVARSFAVACVARALWMLGFQFANIGLKAAITVITPKSIASFILSIFQSGSQLGAMVGAPITGYATSSFGWRLVAFAYAGLALAAFFAILAFMREFHSGAAVAESKEDTTQRPETQSPYRSGLAWALGILVALTTMVAYPLSTFLPVALAQQFKFSPSAVANNLALGSAISIPAMLLTGALSVRVRTRKWIVVAYMAAVGILSLFLNAPNGATVAIVANIMRPLSASVVALNWAMPSDLFPPREIGPVFGIMTMVGALASYFAPQILGVLRDMTGSFAVGWYFCTIMAAAVVVEVLFLKVK